MTTWSWTILGEPVGQGRPRFARMGNHVRAYDPAKSRSWKAIAVEQFACHWDGGPLDQLVRLDVVAVFSRPKRLLRAKDPEGRVPHGAKPDGDNCLKAVADSLERAGVLRNDSLVSLAAVKKQYAAKGEGPRVEVVLSLV